ncbi:MAG: FixH family protein [Bergeyella zoohelcum]|nr:FixH family protein [Bergeyella zoohelcum]
MFKKFTWGHGIIVALGAFMLFILSLIFIYTRGWQNSELVSNDYYEEEINYQTEIDAKTNADLLAEKPAYSQSENGISVAFPKALNIDNNEVSFHLFRTDDARLDVKKDLKLDAEHRLVIPKQVLFAGSYTLKLKWKQEGKNYQIDYNVLWK